MFVQDSLPGAKLKVDLELEEIHVFHDISRNICACYVLGSVAQFRKKLYHINDSFAGAERIKTTTIKQHFALLMWLSYNEQNCLSVGCSTRVQDQNGISRLYNMLEIYHSGPEPSNLA